ncbi:MAG: DUF3604 domain-containing protein [bacterium]|nr:hypothetical protein [Deltaproteobacteria bacterium]MCP4903984.1 DUF3604 domain-containing protein [bacterium]
MNRSAAHPPFSPRPLVILAATLCLFATACESPSGAPAASTHDASTRPVDITTGESVPGPCVDHNPTRNAYFGELHVHTSLSLDAYTFETVGNADDAYRFARGEPLLIAGGRTIQLERPLDFSAVTDHASTMGELRLCTDPESPVYAHRICKVVRNTNPDPKSEDFDVFESAQNVVSGRGVGFPLRNAELCGDDFEICQLAMDSVWAEHQRAAERFQDRSANCRFTTFNGYEYTATPDFAKVHRNVIFRNEIVPDRVVSWVDEPSRWGLWRKLDEDCLQAGRGCDALTIPHNSNLSNGQMFEIDYREDPLEMQVEKARLWQKLEPLIETMQTKGSMECRNGLWRVFGGPDPQCDFEKWRAIDPAPTPCMGQSEAGAILGQGCQSRLDFARYALVEGLREEARIGVNPIKIGHTASTDMHNANPGDTEEGSYDGVLGADDQRPEQRLVRHMKALSPAAFNPGGLVGVWAEENTRDALFDSMKRRETFGTSGTRIQPRFFGRWHSADGLCGAHDFLERAYSGGVAMGGDLPPRPWAGAAPTFVVSAQRDPGAPDLRSLALQKIQIIKAWPGDGEAMHQQVHDVVGDSQSDATVDLTTCEPQGTGYDSLCGSWTDPDFDPDQHAVYYARVLENPSCRWSTIQCNQFAPQDRPVTCDDPLLPKMIQERAWTSPIWYSPQG